MRIAIQIIVSQTKILPLKHNVIHFLWTLVTVIPMNGTVGYGSNFCTTEFGLEFRWKRGCDNVSSCFLSENITLGCGGLLSWMNVKYKLFYLVSSKSLTKGFSRTGHLPFCDTAHWFVHAWYFWIIMKYFTTQSVFYIVMFLESK